MSTAEDAAIETLAESVGVEPSYRDAQGRDQHVSNETKRAVLASMGFNLGSINAIREALQARVDAEWRCLLASVAVLRRSPDAVPSVTVTLPEALLSLPLDWRLELEGGTTHSGMLVPAIRSTLGRNVRHRTNVYLNNRLEQDHRGIKGRIRCMRGFNEHDAADRFCRVHDELRNFLRSRTRHNQFVSTTRRRRRFLDRARIAMGIMQIA